MIQPGELDFVRIFRGAPHPAVEEFLEQCEAVEVGPDELLVSEGENDRSMLIVLRGELQISSGTVPLKRCGPGSLVGELALLGAVETRIASVRTRVTSELLVLTVEGLQNLRASENAIVPRLENRVLGDLASHLRETDRLIAEVAVGTDMERVQNDGLVARLGRMFGRGGAPKGNCPDPVKVLRHSLAFNDLPDDIAAQLARHLEPVAVAAGEKVLSEGSMHGDAFIVADGVIGVYRATRSEKHEKIGSLEQGALFGHVSIIDTLARTATCVAEQPTWLFRIERALCEAVVTTDAPDARTLRRGMIKALGIQLYGANRHLQALTSGQAPIGEPPAVDSIGSVPPPN
jgi:CRP-like cAMP-binding protein